MASLEGLPPLPKSLSGLNLQESLTLQYGSPRSCSLSSESGHFASARSSRSTPRDLTPSSSFSRSARASPVTRPPPPPPRHGRNHDGQRGRLFTLDSQLAVLRKEMFSLRQMDLSLLNQLWALNEAIQEFRQFQDASPPSPPSGDDSDEFYSPLSSRGRDFPSSFAALHLHGQMGRRAHSDTDSESSIEFGNV